MLSELIDDFRSAAIAKADFASPPRRDHALHDRMARAVRELYAAGDPGRSAFKALLRDDSPHVRSWVAAQLLVDGDPDAESVLRELIDLGGLVAFNAEMVLKEHSAGRLESPFQLAGTPVDSDAV